MNVALTWNGMSIQRRIQKKKSLNVHYQLLQLEEKIKNTVRFNLAGQLQQCIRQSHFTHLEYQKSKSISSKYYIFMGNKIAHETPMQIDRN